MLHHSHLMPVLECSLLVIETRAGELRLTQQQITVPMSVGEGGPHELHGTRQRFGNGSERKPATSFPSDTTTKHARFFMFPLFRFSRIFSVCLFLLKFTHVVDNDTTVHDVHADTVAFRPSVLIKCSICSYHQTLTRTPHEWLKKTIHGK